ncbi:MAG: hypothetical protein JWM21_1772 [Acidobacteria bacterium]|nr:hypothetical protein [Acidobacteriota bacterium]
MEKYSLAATLAGMTSKLEPAPGVSRDQLELLRVQLSEIIPQQDISTMTAGSTARLDALSTQPGIVDEGLLQALEAQLSDLSTAVTDASPADASGLRAFRRELPVRTSQHPASVPAWAAGMEVNHTLGPFIDHTGKWYWFDFFRRVHSVTVARGTDVFLKIPVRGFLSRQSHYELGAGSVWIRSQLLTPASPAGAFTGLKIKRGSISFNNAVTISGSSIVINSPDTCELKLELDQPLADIATDTTAGTDAKDLVVNLPEQVTISCHPGSAIVQNASDGSQQLYGVSYQYTKLAGSALFDPLLNRILIPYSSNSGTVTAPLVASDLINLSGAGAISAAYWALPVTIATISQLGNAVGAGAFAMLVKKGMNAKWFGLAKAQLHLMEFYILTEPGRIAVTAAQGSARGGRQSFDLWDEDNAAKEIRSQVHLKYASSFLFLYNCLSIGVETIVMNKVTMDAGVDRPLTADGQRLAIHAPAANLFLFKIKADRLIYLQAVNILQQLMAAHQTSGLRPISFALRNAFIKTTPVDDFYLIGAWSSATQINKGFLLLDCPLYFLTPTLPDPYVTNYNPLRFGRQELASNTRSQLSLTGIVQWPEPAKPKLLLMLIPDSTSLDVFTTIENAVSGSPKPANINDQDVRNSGDQPLVAAGKRFVYSYAAARQNQIAEVQQEDADNIAALRTLFDRSLQVGGEQIFLLDVSTNADLFGVGIGVTKRERQTKINSGFPFFVLDMDLVTYAFNTRIYTLPQVQWEPVQTIQNPDVKPYPFPSPATSPNTGDPTIIATESYRLVPITPKQVVDTFIAEYNEPDSRRMAARFSLPFGMESTALLQNPHDASKPGAQVAYNGPDFDDPQVSGGLQISIIATSPQIGPAFESPHFKGATIQTRNLIELLTGSIPLDDDGKPLSVLGPVVDTIFNGEFRPAGNNPRVPLERMDLSGYGASIFSNWLNPNAQIAATSQTRFDVMIGRTSHEIIQVKSILYPWGIAVVRTITIQRTAGGGVTRYDSGWRAQGPGLYDFSYRDQTKTLHANPFEFHPGIIKGMYDVTEIRDTGRTYRQPAANPNDDVIMQEVFFNADVLVENVVTGAAHGYVPSKKQRGFVQLSPYQKPLTPQQFYDLLVAEGALGGPVDCVVNVGASGEHMGIVRVDVNGVDDTGGKVFVSAGHGSLALPKEGAWSLVKRKNSSNKIITLDEDGALPLIREGKLTIIATQPYRFADPADIKQAPSPDTDYGLLHSTGSQKVLFLRPTIAQNDPHIKSTINPFFADSYALLGSKGIFPSLDATFGLGGGGTSLLILGSGKLQLTSGGNFKAPAGRTRDLLNSGGSRIYVDYSDAGGGANTSDVAYLFDSTAPVPWKASVKTHSIVIDLLAFKGLITVTSDFKAEAGTKPGMTAPVMKFGPVLQPIVDLLSFLGDFNMAQAFRVSMGNATTDSWQPKWKASLLGLKIEFPLLQIKAFGVSVGGVSEAVQDAFEIATPLPPLKLGFEIEIEGHYNMRPFSFTSNDPTTDIAKEKDDMLSVGASLKFGGEIHILCVAISPTLGLYFFGLLQLEFGIDSKEGKSFEFKVGVGLELATKWPVVGKVAISMAVALDMEFKDTGHGMFVLMIFKGEAELLGGLIAIGISIEAKGGQETETDAGVDKTFGVCEVEFAAEVTIAFFIHFEFDVTWQERKQLS